MQVYTALDQIPSTLGHTVVTIGNFDGIHTGHQAVIDRTLKLARQHQLTPVLISFDPHPSQVHRPDQPHHQITSLQQRQDYLEELGVEHYLLLPYTLDFAQQSPREFVKTTLVDALKTAWLVAGEDIRFGYQNQGNLATMIELGKEYGFEVSTVADHTKDQKRCSSTWIRALLADGKISEANTLLGRNHTLRGEVVHGAARGRELGYPTANLSLTSEGLVPADGVYAGWLTDESGTRHPVATSVGTNPTFEGIENRQVEAHVMGRPQEAVTDFDLYGQTVTLEFVQWLRPMVAYTGVEALINQLAQDVIAAQKALGI